MMPIGFNITLTNPKALHSKLVNYTVDIWLVNKDPKNGTSLFREMIIRDCLKVSMDYPNMLWPYAGNLKIILGTDDNDMCKEIDEKDVKITISLMLHHLDPIIHSDALDEADLYDMMNFTIMLDYIPTP